MALKNFSAEQPHQHALYYMSFLLEELAWHKDELIEALEGRDVEVNCTFNGCKINFSVVPPSNCEIEDRWDHIRIRGPV